MKKSFGARTLIFPTPIWCVGSYDKQDRPNVMTIAWGGVCCSSPPCVTISLRKATYTYGNIMDKMAYTLSVPSENYATEADYFGMATGRKEDKFERSGLTPVRSDLVDAPFVAEFPMILECRVIHHHEIGLHTQFIGEILDVKVEEAALGESGKPDMRKVSPIAYASEVSHYHGVGRDLGKAFDIGRTLMKS